MKIYVSAAAVRSGSGTHQRPFKTIGEAAKVARAGDEVIVAPGIYREWVDPHNAGTEENRIPTSASIFTIIALVPLMCRIAGRSRRLTLSWKQEKA